MPIPRFSPFWLCIGIGSALVLSYLFYFCKCEFEIWSLTPTQRVINAKLAREGESFKGLQYNLIGPTQAPDDLKELVVLGYNIVVRTQEFAPGYAGNRLCCTNCHFAAGISTGGKRAGISLAGVAASYPQFSTRSKKVITLRDRINNCFMRSMNGKALPMDSKEMVALETYFQWISKNFPIYQDVPWLGSGDIDSKHVPDAKAGEKIYSDRCALCHGANGEGDKQIPPLWGPDSFNDGAGMNVMSMIAPFVYQNMPYTDPTLTQEEALDVAAYVISRPRPHFEKK
jgi:thiosulfate dehydrogenase